MGPSKVAVVISMFTSFRQIYFSCLTGALSSPVMWAPNLKCKEFHPDSLRFFCADECVEKSLLCPDLLFPGWMVTDFEELRVECFCPGVSDFKVFWGLQYLVAFQGMDFVFCTHFQISIYLILASIKGHSGALCNFDKHTWWNTAMSLLVRISFLQLFAENPDFVFYRNAAPFSMIPALRIFVMQPLLEDSTSWTAIIRLLDRYLLSMPCDCEQLFGFMSSMILPVTFPGTSIRMQAFASRRRCAYSSISVYPDQLSIRVPRRMCTWVCTHFRSMKNAISSSLTRRKIPMEKYPVVGDKSHNLIFSFCNYDICGICLMSLDNECYIRSKDSFVDILMWPICCLW